MVVDVVVMRVGASPGTVAVAAARFLAEGGTRGNFGALAARVVAGCHF